MHHLPRSCNISEALPVKGLVAHLAWFDPIFSIGVLHACTAHVVRMLNKTVIHVMDKLLVKLRISMTDKTHNKFVRLNIHYETMLWMVQNIKYIPIE